MALAACMPARTAALVEDWAALKRYAQFDPDYLYGDGPLKVEEDWD